MKRPDPVLHHLTAAVLYAWALVAVSYAWHSTALASWLTATVVCYLASVAAFQAVQASWRAWRDWRATAGLKSKVTPPPSASAPLWPKTAADDVSDGDEAGQHAAAMAEVAADTPLPERTGTVAFAAVMPIARVYSPWARKITDPSKLPWMAPARHGREPVGGGVR